MVLVKARSIVLYLRWLSRVLLNLGLLTFLCNFVRYERYWILIVISTSIFLYSRLSSPAFRTCRFLAWCLRIDIDNQVFDIFASFIWILNRGSVHFVWWYPWSFEDVIRLEMQDTRHLVDFIVLVVCRSLIFNQIIHCYSGICHASFLFIDGKLSIFVSLIINIHIVLFISVLTICIFNIFITDVLLSSAMLAFRGHDLRFYTLHNTLYFLFFFILCWLQALFRGAMALGQTAEYLIFRQNTGLCNAIMFLFWWFSILFV